MKGLLISLWDLKHTNIPGLPLFQMNVHPISHTGQVKISFCNLSMYLDTYLSRDSSRLWCLIELSLPPSELLCWSWQAFSSFTSAKFLEKGGGIHDLIIVINQPINPCVLCVLPPYPTCLAGGPASVSIHQAVLQQPPRLQIIYFILI